jgi:hypothetical protein
MADKLEYPPLFAPGFHDCRDEELDEIFSERFDPPIPRRKMLRGFRSLIRKVRSFGLAFEVWIDGSFATWHPFPGDVDALFVFERDELNNAPPEIKAELEALFASGDARRETKLRYDVHSWMVLQDNDDRKNYWSGFFGTARDGTPKGIPVMRCTP